MFGAVWLGQAYPGYARTAEEDEAEAAVAEGSSGGSTYESVWAEARPFPVTGIAKVRPIRHVAVVARVVAKVAVYARSVGRLSETRVASVKARGGIGGRAKVRSASAAAWVPKVEARGIKNPIRELVAAWMLLGG